MRHLLLKHLGPLTSADIELGKVNLLIGYQSSGKSCVLKAACYCTWVEKRIELTQSIKEFEGESFLEKFVSYHRMEGYISDDTVISYESSYMRFKYDNRTKSFEFGWKTHRWEYRRPKVSYIPSERSIVSLLPDVMLLNSYDNIVDFVGDWDQARKSMKEDLRILNLGVKYRYVEDKGLDRVLLSNGKELQLTNTSSGVQSLVPLYVHLSYILSSLHSSEKNRSQKTKIEESGLLLTLYRMRFQMKGKTEIRFDGSESRQFAILPIGDYQLPFSSEAYADEFKAVYSRFQETDHLDLFIEEPEDNLFPPTQCRLVDWILGLSEGAPRNTYMITTHSPYILNHILSKQPKGFKFFFTYPVGDGMSAVKTATESDIQEIFDNGVDMFFNFETFIE